MKRDRFILVAWCVVVAFTLGATAFWLSKYQSVWSPDSGALLALARSWATGDSPAYPRYALQNFDPDWLLHPLTGQGYVVQTAHGHALVYGPLLPILAGAGFRAFGFFGLALPSIAAGILASLAALLTAREMRLKYWWVAGALGVATPLAVYGAVFWHHAATICVAAWAIYFLTRGTERGEAWPIFLSGLTLGFGLFFHELSMALALAILFAVIPNWTVIARFACGFGTGLASWMLANQWLYGTPFGPHVAGANNVLGSKVYRPALFDLGGMLDRGAVQLFGFPPNDPAVWSMAACLIVAFLIGRQFGPMAKWQYARPVAYVFVFLAAILAWSTWRRDTVNNGLLQTTPLFMLAVIVPGKGAKDRTLMLRTCLFFTLLVILNPIPPLMGWGSRFLVTLASPLLCLSLAAAEERTGRWFLFSLLGLSLISQVRGLKVVQSDLVYSRQLCRAVESFHAPVVSELPWLGPECEAAKLNYPLMIIGDTMYTPRDLDAARKKVLQYLDEFRPPEIVFCGPVTAKDFFDSELAKRGFGLEDRGFTAGVPFARYRARATR